MIRIKCTGDFKNTTKFLERAKKMSITDILNRYGKQGVNALAAATPQDTGETASSWGYEISAGTTRSTITWTNGATSGGTPIVIFIQYGHGTRNGGYVSGVDFINPAIKGVMDQMVDSIWKEVTKV